TFKRAPASPWTMQVLPSAFTPAEFELNVSYSAQAKSVSKKRFQRMAPTFIRRERPELAQPLCSTKKTLNSSFRQALPLVFGTPLNPFRLAKCRSRPGHLTQVAWDTRPSFI